MKKSIANIFLTVAIMVVTVVCFMFSVSAAYENNYENIGDHRKDIIGVAKTQLGYTEGTNNDNKYGASFNHNNVAWCAYFVSWCARQAGIPESVLQTSSRAGHASGCFNIPVVNHTGTCYEQSGCDTNSNYVPKPGDLFFTKSWGHVGLVYYVDGDYFYTIEGNSNSEGSNEGWEVCSNRRYIKDYYFGVPKYTTIAVSHTTNTNYGKNYTAYLKSPSTNHYVFDSNHSSTGGYVNGNDPCTIYEVYTDGCCKFTYILDSGNTRTAYGKIEWFNSHTHSYSSKVTKAATCTNTGTRTYTCSCGNSYTETISALGHDYSGQRVHQGEHPHEISQRCIRYDSCGGYKWTGENASLKSCSKCWKATWTLSQSSISVNVGKSKSIDCSIDGVWPDTRVLTAEWDTDLFDLTVEGKSLTVKGKKSGSGEIKMYLYSDSNKTTLIGSKTISVKVVSKNYTIIYYPNGGSGEPDSQTKIEGVDLTLSSVEPTRKGYSFRGWATSIAATMPEYLPGDIYKQDVGASMYAVWKKVFYGDVNKDGIIDFSDISHLDKIIDGLETATSFDKFVADVNGDDILDFDDILEINKFKNKSIHSFSVENMFNSFVVEYNGKSSYRPGESINKASVSAYVLYSNANYYRFDGEELSIYPEYASGSGQQKITVSLGDWSGDFYITVDDTISYTLSYNANGGNGAPPSVSDSKSYIISSVVPTRVGYTFLGWSRKSTATAASYVAGDSISLKEDTTLYAVWHSHSYTSIITKAATCTTDGVRTYTCSGCSYSYTEKINKTGHNWTVATCTAPKTCSTCGTKDGSVPGHSYTSKVTTAATCTTDGVRTYTCSKCSHSYTEKIDKTGHSWTTATCTLKKTCSTCGITEGSALGHSYSSKITNVATCTTNGTKTYTCSRCSDSYAETITATGHNWMEATCTSKKTCLTCGTTDGSVLGHSYAVKTTKEPTCTTSGTKVYDCSRCSDSYTETIPSTDHSYISTVVAPTCTEEGYTLKKCRNCDYSQKVDYTEAVGHNMGQWKTTREETCTEDGERSRKCLNCDYAQTQIIYASGHSMGSWKTTKQATCTENGEKKNSCLNCDYYTIQTVYASGHSMSAWKTVKKATCTENGTKHSSCSECDYTEVKMINSNGHSYISEVTKEATCTTAGVKTFSCSVCEDSYAETIAKLGHKYSSSYTTDKKATCLAEGSKSKHCTRSGCTAKTSVTAIAKLAHTYDNNCDKTCNVCKATRSISHSYKNVTTKATLTKNGKVENKCSVCGYVSKTTTVYYPKTIKLSAASYIYNGKAKTPTVTVKDSKGNTLKKDTDYTVSYASGRKNTGKYSVTVTFKGKYSGKKVLYFNILPSKTSKITPTCGTTSLKASWSKVTGASGYKVELLNSKGKVVKIVTTTKTAYTFEKLSKVTTYKIRVTAYKTIDSKKVYSTSYTTITTSTAPAKVTLSKVSAGSKSATPTWKKVSGASGYEVMYSTSSKFSSSKTATVNKGSSTKTTIKKLTKGKKYYFKVRAYKTVDGKKIYSACSAVKSVKVK